MLISCGSLLILSLCISIAQFYTHSYKMFTLQNSLPCGCKGFQSGYWVELFTQQATQFEE